MNRMNNILNAARLDAALVKPYFRSICFTLLLPLVFTAINRSLFTGVSFAMCFIAMTSGYTFSIAEKNNMDRLFGILPVQKSSLVLGRDLFILAMGLLALTVSLIGQPLVLRALGESVAFADILTAALAGLFLFTLYTVFQIPGYYRLGSIRGRVFMYIPVAGFLAILLFFRGPQTGSSALAAALRSPASLAVFVIALTIIMYAASIIASIRIVRQKES